MTHVSKNKLKQKDFNKLYQQLNGIVGLLDKSKSQLFFDELLTDTEKVMLTKRLSAVIMLMYGYSAYTVAHILQMSTSTTDRMLLNLETGYYTEIENILKKQKENRDQFWNMLELILRGGLPPRGKGRWKRLHKSLDK